MVESGVATVMFTDLVGSMRMRDELGDDVTTAVKLGAKPLLEAVRRTQSTIGE